MTFTPASPSSVAVFLVIVVAVTAAIPAGTWWAHRRLGLAPAKPALWVTAIVLAWLALTSGVIARGTIEARPMPGVPLFVGAANLAALAFALSALGGRLAAGLPLAALVAFQSFRLPLELVLHAWADQGTIPRTMTWTGQNVDIVTGVVAILTAPFASRFRAAAWIANVVGFVLLANVARVAVMSSPLPFAWPDVQPPLQLVMHLPYGLIAPVCVGGALAGHIVLTRALLTRAR